MMHCDSKAKVTAKRNKYCFDILILQIKFKINASLHSEFLLIIRAGGVEGGSRIIAGDAVFGDKCGDVGIGVAVEEAIVADTETNDYVEIGMDLVQKACLKDGVAHCRADFFTFGRNAHRGLGTSFDLADDCVWLKTAGTEDAGEDACFIDQADTVGYADASCADLTGKLHNFLDTGPLAVSFIFDFRARLHYLEIAVFFITLQSPGGIFFREISRETEIGICPYLEFTILSAAVNAAESLFFHFRMIGKKSGKDNNIFSLSLVERDDTMKRIVLLLTLAIMGGSADAQKNEGNTLELVIGTYGGHIYRYSFNTETLEYTPSGRAEAVNASYVLEDEGNIFAVSESGSGSGAYSFVQERPDTIRMTAHLTQTGADPCFVMIHRAQDGSRYMMTADYSGGSISVFPIRDGNIESRVAQMHFEGSGPVKGRQGSSHIHQVKEIPHHSGYILASDLGADCIRLIKASAADDGLEMKHINDISCPPGSGPRHMEFSLDGKTLYCLTELGGEVLRYRIESKGGVPEFNLVQRILADEVNAGGSADIHIHPSGKWLYTSHRLDNDGIAAFKIEEDGTLTKTGYSRTARHPRNFLITPDGKLLIAACLNDGIVQVFEIKQDGSLKLTPSVLRLDSDRPSSVTVIR